jgi:peptide deformylase
MAVRPIVTWPDARLREETEAVGEVNAKTRALFEDLRDTMFASNGLGIAAPQIGESASMFLIEASLNGAEPGAEPLCLIDPEILWLSEETETADEGCLSFPSIYVPIARALKARFRATNLAGERIEIEAEGLFARALQHENDHLTGRLLVAFVGPLTRQKIKRKMTRLAEAGADEGSHDAARDP